MTCLHCELYDNVQQINYESTLAAVLPATKDHKPDARKDCDKCEYDQIFNSNRNKPDKADQRL